MPLFAGLLIVLMWAAINRKLNISFWTFALSHAIAHTRNAHARPLFYYINQSFMNIFRKPTNNHLNKQNPTEIDFSPPVAVCVCWRA